MAYVESLNSVQVIELSYYVASQTCSPILRGCEAGAGWAQAQCANASGKSSYTASRNALCRGTLPNGRYWVNKTAVILFFGSTQNRVSAAPSQKNSPTAPEASPASAGWRMRTAKSMPNPTNPLLGSHEVSVTSAGMAS